MSPHTLAALLTIGIAIAVCGAAIGVLATELRRTRPPKPDPYPGLSADARRALGLPPH